MLGDPLEASKLCSKRGPAGEGPGVGGELLRGREDPAGLGNARGSSVLPAFLGLKFFQSASGTIFDNFQVTDDEQYSKQMLTEVFLNIRDAEVRAYDRLVGKITSEKDIEKNRDQRIKKMRDIDRMGDDLSDSEKEKETPEQKAARLRKAKRDRAKKRANERQFADFDSL
jgi:hypothetical protein